MILPAVTSAAGSDVLLHVLLAMGIALGRVLGVLFARLGQPPVIGEVIAGILLGPSLLGRVAPDVAAYLLPAHTAPYLGVIAQLGVVLYLFLVGLELNSGVLRQKIREVLIAQAGILVPFVLGVTVALILFAPFAPAGVPFTSFALFMGVAMSVTAFPVLARILTDRKMSRTKLGVLALTCAAISDVTAWCLLAFVVSASQARAQEAVRIAGLTVAYFVFMFLLVRPLATRLAMRYPREVPQGVVTVVLVALLLSSVATEWIGIHALFGAFLLGAVIPHDSTLARFFTRRLEDLVTILLLPAFFALTGMRTEIGLVSGVGE
jgi:Kef-type K+ transport system membrane component KefB